MQRLPAGVPARDLSLADFSAATNLRQRTPGQYPGGGGAGKPFRRNEGSLLGIGREDPLELVER